MARVDINRNFLLTVKADGKARYISDAKLRGFCVKVHPCSCAPSRKRIAPVCWKHSNIWPTSAR